MCDSKTELVLIIKHNIRIFAQNPIDNSFVNLICIHLGLLFNITICIRSRIAFALGSQCTPIEQKPNTKFQYTMWMLCKFQVIKMQFLN